MLRVRQGLLLALCLSTGIYAELKSRPEQTTAPAPVAAVPASAAQNRVYLTIQKYIMDSNGEPSNPISNVRITMTLPNGTQMPLPEGGQFWPIGNGQVQEINRTYEIPAQFINNDAMKLTIQMERKGSKIDPCLFEVGQISQFNRQYICHTDVAWQQNQNVPPEKISKEGIQIRVFSTANLNANEIPKDAIAIR